MTKDFSAARMLVATSGALLGMKSTQSSTGPSLHNLLSTGVLNRDA